LSKCNLELFIQTSTCETKLIRMIAALIEMRNKKKKWWVIEWRNRSKASMHFQLFSVFNVWIIHCDIKIDRDTTENKIQSDKKIFLNFFVSFFVFCSSSLFILSASKIDSQNGKSVVASQDPSLFKLYFKVWLDYVRVCFKTTFLLENLT
jgi:hypothetical protein